MSNLESARIVATLKHQRLKLLDDRDKLAKTLGQDFHDVTYIETETLATLTQLAIDAVDNMRKYQQLLIEQIIEEL